MNEVEENEFKRLKSIQSLIGGSLAIILPFSVVYAFSSRYNMGTYYGKFLNSTLMLCGFGYGTYYINNKQRQFLN